MTVPASPADPPPAAQPRLRRPAVAGRLVEPEPARPLPAMRTARVERDDGAGTGPRVWLVEAPAHDDDGPSTVRSVPAEDPAAWCGSLVRAAVEVLGGSRPVAQLARWLSADLYESLARRAGLAVRIKGRPTVVRQAVVRKVRVCQLSPVLAEAAVVVHDGARVRAAAIRIEAHRGRWRATALEIG